MSDRLLVALRDLPVDWPEVPAIPAPALGGPVRRPALVPRFAGALALAAAVVVGFVTPARDAVADWLGIGAVRVFRVADLPADLGTTLDLGDEVAAGSVGFEWPVPLGPPDGAYVREGEASLVWAPSRQVPEVARTGVGAILTRFEAALDPAVEKSIGEGTTLRVVTIGERRAYWIEGDLHSIGLVGPGGQVIPATVRLAGNTLVWAEDGSTWRFESALDLESVIDVLFGG